jgi:hypothetical protein
MILFLAGTFSIPKSALPQLPSRRRVSSADRQNDMAEEWAK